MAAFNLTNFYCNESQYNTELLFDGVLYAYPIGGFMYLMTTTGIFRYIFNKSADASDYGVWNRDVAYICYEVPSVEYYPSVLMSSLGFINRNGLFCVLSMDSGELKRVGSWSFPVGLQIKDRINIWGFINDLGNACFVVGDRIFDVTMRAQDNVVGIMGDINVSGFKKFSIKTKYYELVVLRGKIGDALSGNFSDGAVSFSSVSIGAEDCLKTFYVRWYPNGYGKESMLLEPKESIALMEEEFGNKNGLFSVANNGIYNTNYNVEPSLHTDMSSMFCLGFDAVGVNMPLIINKIPELVKVPKISISFASMFFSNFIKYISENSGKNNNFSRFSLEILINSQKYDSVDIISSDSSNFTKEIDTTSVSRFVEINTGNAADNSIKIEVLVKQYLSVGDRQLPVSISDGIYMNPVQLIYAPYSNIA